MSLLPLKFPPGVYRPGTPYDAKGRWYLSDLVRWYEGQMQAWGGWSSLTSVATAGGTAAPVRGMAAVAAYGVHPVILYFATPAEIFVRYGSSFVAEVTPTSGFTPGSNYASGTYPWTEVEAPQWFFEQFGSYMLALLSSEGKVWQQYTYSGASVNFQLDADIPTGSCAMVVTPENFLMLLGEAGVPNKIRWADQGAIFASTDWTPATTNQAGDKILPGDGRLMCGLRGRGETLIWTNVDMFVARYIGGDFIYTFDKVGSQCGVISRKAAAVVDGKAIWMGAKGFFGYDGFVRKIPCEVADYVFNDLNMTQRSAIAADVRSDFGEVIWYYPSASSSTNNRYVAYNYVHGFWMIGSIIRTCGLDRGALQYPVAASEAGVIYSHETGTSYTDTGGTAQVPVAESGPLELGDGERVMSVLQYIPDEKTLGDVSLSILHRMYPTGTETTSGPFTAANPTSVRLTARQIRIKIAQVTAGWRFGTPRLDVVPRGKR